MRDRRKILFLHGIRYELQGDPTAALELVPLGRSRMGQLERSRMGRRNIGADLKRDDGSSVRVAMVGEKKLCTIYAPPIPPPAPKERRPKQSKRIIPAIEVYDNAETFRGLFLAVSGRFDGKWEYVADGRLAGIDPFEWGQWRWDSPGVKPFDSDYLQSRVIMEAFDGVRRRRLTDIACTADRLAFLEDHDTEKTVNNAITGDGVRFCRSFPVDEDYVADGMTTADWIGGTVTHRAVVYPLSIYHHSVYADSLYLAAPDDYDYAARDADILETAYAGTCTGTSYLHCGYPNELQHGITQWDYPDTGCNQYLDADCIVWREEATCGSPFGPARWSADGLYWHWDYDCFPYPDHPKAEYYYTPPDISDNESFVCHNVFFRYDNLLLDAPDDIQVDDHNDFFGAQSSVSTVVGDYLWWQGGHGTLTFDGETVGGGMVLPTVTLDSTTTSSADQNTDAGQTFTTWAAITGKAPGVVTYNPLFRLTETAWIDGEEVEYLSEEAAAEYLLPYPEVIHPRYFVFAGRVYFLWSVARWYGEDNHKEVEYRIAEGPLGGPFSITSEIIFEDAESWDRYHYGHTFPSPDDEPLVFSDEETIWGTGRFRLLLEEIYDDGA